MSRIKLHGIENIKPLDIDQKINRPDPTKHFAKRLRTIRSVSDASDLISDINQVLQTEEYLDSNAKSDLKKIRQRSYDRKKKFLNNIKIMQQSVPMQGRSDERQKSESDHVIDAADRLKSIDFKSIIRQIPKIILFGTTAILTTLFTWSQSIPLYESIGFPEPKFCALGAILMIAGFSTIYSVTRSKLVLILCIYASLYEVLLIINGTMQHETTQIQNSVEKNQDLIWLQEQAQYSNQIYHSIKDKYDDPTSKVFQNNWYKDKYINSAWENYSADQNKVSQKRIELETKFGSNHNTGTLKILFRLGLVFLCMISIHYFLLLFNRQKAMG